MIIKGFLLMCVSALDTAMMSTARKRYDRHCGNSMSAAMGLPFFCFSLVVLFLLIWQGGFPQFDAVAFLLAGIYGVLSLLNTVLAIGATHYGNISMIGVFCSLGSLCLSPLYGFIFNPQDNGINVPMILGYALSLTVLGLNFKTDVASQNRTKQQKRRFNLCCLGLFVATGICAVLFYVKKDYAPTFPNNDFILLYMLVSTVVAGLWLLWLFIKPNTRTVTKQSVAQSFRPCVVWIFPVYALLIGLGEWTALAATSFLPVVVKAPLSFSLPVVFTAAMDFAFYRSKPSGRQWLQIGLSVLASLCFVL